VNDADDEDGAAIVTEGEGIGSRSVGCAEGTDTPGGVTRSGDEKGDAAAGDVVMVGGIRFAAEKADEDVDGEDDEGGSDETLADGVHAARKGEVKEDDGSGEESDGESMAECVEEAEPHTFPPGALNAGDVGDGGEVVVVETVTKAQEGAGEKGEFKRRRHCCLLGYREWGRVGEVEWPRVLLRSRDGFGEGDGWCSGSEAEGGQADCGDWGRWDCA